MCYFIYMIPLRAMRRFLCFFGCFTVLFLLHTHSAKAAISTDGLVGYWKLDEGSGTTAADSSGHGNDGTLTNGPTWSADPTNDISFTNPYALDFDGGNDYVDTGTAPELLLNESDITLIAWVHHSNDVLSAILEYGPGGNGYFWGLSPTKQRFIIYGAGKSYFSNTTVPTNEWSHIAMSWDNSADTASFYLNGVIDGTPTNSIDTSGNTSDILRIGARSSSSFQFDGLIDDVRIYNRALSADEITELANGTHTTATWDGSSSTDWETAANWDIGAIPDPYTRITIADTSNDPVVSDDLVGYWKFDEGSGTSAADSSGNGNTGTLTNGPTWSADPTNDISFTNPYALDFDGSDDYVDVGDSTFWDTVFANDYSISFWFNANTLTDGNDVFIDKWWDGSVRQFSILYESASVQGPPCTLKQKKRMIYEKLA